MNEIHEVIHKSIQIEDPLLKPQLNVIIVVNLHIC